MNEDSKIENENVYEDGDSVNFLKMNGQPLQSE